MGLEQRGNNRYYYRKVRRGRRVVSAYVGRGEFGAACAAMDTLDQHQRTQDRHAWAAERATIEAADALVNELALLARAIMVETLHAAGYHQHKRQWRKRRD